MVVVASQATQKRFKTHGHCRRQLGYSPHREQYAWHERLPIRRVMANRQRLARSAKRHLLMGHQTGQAHGVYGHPADLRPGGTT